MGRVMGCGLCPYNAIEKVGNYVGCATIVVVVCLSNSSH